MRTPGSERSQEPERYQQGVYVNMTKTERNIEKRMRDEKKKLNAELTKVCADGLTRGSYQVKLFYKVLPFLSKLEGQKGPKTLFCFFLSKSTSRKSIPTTKIKN
jgi:hypothetical protein